ncbi:MAG: hypothetical protein R3246_13915 [Acidimicrobiia bacterium]|nr:hypothetical protein [Acidimicrobiia bacterium]
MVVNIDKFLEPSEIGGGVFPVGPASGSAAALLDLSPPAPPTPGVLTGTGIISQDHPDAADTGYKFEFKVPEDYNAGPLTIKIGYAMSTAVSSPNNVIRVEHQAQIARAQTGAVDTATYPATGIDLTVPDGVTDYTQSTIFVISEGDFDPGDSLMIFIRRLGTHGNDLHTGAWKVVSYDVSYEAIISSKVITLSFGDILDTDETPGTPNTLSGFETIDFLTGADNEGKVQFTIPDNWDGLTDILVKIIYAMSTSETNTVRIDTEGETTNLGTGGTTALAVVPFFIPTSADTGPHRSPAVRQIPAAGLTQGDTISLKIARRGTQVEDTHGGSFKIIAVCGSLPPCSRARCP